MFRPETAYNGEFNLDFTCHTPNELLDIVRNEMDDYVKIKTLKHKRKVEYYNVPAGFDIETTSWTSGKEKLACQVCWQFGINGHVCLGRTYAEFILFHEALKNLLGLDYSRRLILYVHNLGFEFQWYHKRLKFSEVFALKSRKPAYAYEDGYEWKDSLILTNTTLEKSAEDLTKYKINKLDTWDYKKKRHHLTPLDKGEVEYAMYDVLVVMALIKEKMEQEGGFIIDIPMTSTGYVRRDCKRHTIQGANKEKYTRLIRSLKVTPDEYTQLKRAFMGGFTHASHNHVGKIMENCMSLDFTSSYPAVMVMEPFPMGQVTIDRPKNQEELEDIFRKYCCVFDIKLTNVRPKIDYEHILSKSKCYVENCTTDNGRIITADVLITTITNEDYWMIKEFYNYDEVTISNLKVYRKMYLPKELVERILYYYKQKTTLKDVEGKEVEYNLNKAMVNSIYGMMVMDIVREDISYIEDWEDSPEPNVEKMVSDYNTSKSRFLYYPWGVFVTAYARRNLLRGIIACKENYIYSDTDSIKFRKEGAEHFLEWVDEYNEEVRQKMEAAMRYQGFDINEWRPKTITGKEKPLGYWDYDGEYDRFKTLGAKRYIVEKDGKIKTTVAGSSKKEMPKYLKKEAEKKNKDPLIIFDNKLTIPPEDSGKLGAFYLDEVETDLVDYMGTKAHISEKSCCALIGISFSMTMSDEFFNYIFGNYDTNMLTN